MELQSSSMLSPILLKLAFVNLANLEFPKSSSCLFFEKYSSDPLSCTTALGSQLGVHKDQPSSSTLKAWSPFDRRPSWGGVPVYLHHT